VDQAPGLDQVSAIGAGVLASPPVVPSTVS
jgi:hypothetical protein